MFKKNILITAVLLTLITTFTACFDKEEKSGIFINEKSGFSTQIDLDWLNELQNMKWQIEKKFRFSFIENGIMSKNSNEEDQLKECINSSFINALAKISQRANSRTSIIKGEEGKFSKGYSKKASMKYEDILVSFEKNELTSEGSKSIDSKIEIKIDNITCSREYESKDSYFKDIVNCNNDVLYEKIQDLIQRKKVFIKTDEKPQQNCTNLIMFR